MGHLSIVHLPIDHLLIAHLPIDHLSIAQLPIDHLSIAQLPIGHLFIDLYVSVKLVALVCVCKLLSVDLLSVYNLPSVIFQLVICKLPVV